MLGLHPSSTRESNPSTSASRNRRHFHLVVARTHYLWANISSERSRPWMIRRRNAQRGSMTNSLCTKKQMHPHLNFSYPGTITALRKHSSDSLSLAEATSNTMLHVESSIVRRPLAVMCQLKVETTYDLRSDFEDLSHGNLHCVSSCTYLTCFRDSRSCQCIGEYQHRNASCIDP
jgi:hypothetical protein